MKKFILVVVLFSVDMLVGLPARADIVRTQPGLPPRLNVMDSTPGFGRYVTPKAMKSIRYVGIRAPRSMRLR